MSSATGAIQDGCVYFGDIDSDVQKLRVRAGHNLASSRQAMHSGQVWVSGKHDNLRARIVILTPRPPS